MNGTRTCPECGAPLTEARRGVCPRCMLRAALNPSTGEDDPIEERPPSIHLVLADGTTAAALPFRQLGDYDLIEEVGHGGMGVIFKARQRSLDRIVALKLIRAGSLAKAGDVARFRTEAAAAARLQHPNIVAVYEVGENGGQQFYSMEFVAGRSLAQSLREGPLAPRDASRVLRTVAEAIHFAHQHGVLHRDLKPSNILLDADGEPRVADFGLAKFLQTEIEMTLSGAVIGSPQYMSPEQARGRSAQASASSDIYSLGAILYELLTGRPPFSAATPLETMKLVVEQEAIAPRRLNSSLPRDLETICLKCLAKEPQGRFASAQEVADELGRFLRDEPIRSRPVGPLERGWRWCRRRPAPAALGAVLALAPAIIICVLLVMRAKVAAERNLAVHQEQITRQNLYAEDISLAGRALQENDYGGAWRALVAQIPSASGPDLRGFEWRWLWRRVQGEARHAFPAHLGRIHMITYSPDARWVASASADGTVKLWDARDEQWRRTFEEPGVPRLREFTDQPNEFKNQMMSADFTADSQGLLTGSSRGVGLWELGSGRQRSHLFSNEVFISMCSPRNPGQALALPAYPRTNLFLVNLETSVPTPLLTGGRADTICFSPDGRQFARWDRDARRVWLHTLPEGNVVGSFSAPGAYVFTMAFTPDGRNLALANMNKDAVELFDIATQAKVGELTGHAGRLMALAISPDGTLLAAGGSDQTIHLWDLPGRGEARQLRGHRSMVSALAFSPDSRTLASGGTDGTVRFWDLSALPQSPAPLEHTRDAFAFSADSRRLITQDTKGTAQLWQLPDRHLLRAWSMPLFGSAVFTANGRLVLAGCGSAKQPPFVHQLALDDSQTTESSSSGPSRVSDAPPNCTSIELSGIDSPCSVVALAPDGLLAATGHQDGTVALWDARSGRLRRKMEHQFFRNGQPTPVDALTISANGQTLVAAGFTPVLVKTWTLPEGRPIATGAAGIVYSVSVAVSPDGQRIATCGLGQGANIHLWNAELRTRELSLRGHLDHGTAVAFAPDGRTLATGSVDGMLKLWHLATQRDVATLLSLEPNDQVNSLLFSPDGQWLGAVTKNHALHLFSAPRPFP